MFTADAKELLLEAVLTRDPDIADQTSLASKIGPRRVKAIIDSLETFSREMRPKVQRLSDEVYRHTNGLNAYRRLIEQANEVISPSEMQCYGSVTLMPCELSSPICARFTDAKRWPNEFFTQYDPLNVRVTHIQCIA